MQQVNVHTIRRFEVHLDITGLCTHINCSTHPPTTSRNWPGIGCPFDFTRDWVHIKVGECTCCDSNISVSHCALAVRIPHCIHFSNNCVCNRRKARKEKWCNKLT